MASALGSNAPAITTICGESPGTAASSASWNDASCAASIAATAAAAWSERISCHSTVSPVTCTTTARPACSSKARMSMPGMGSAAR